MNNSKFKINSHSGRHSEDTSEGSAQLINLVEIPCLPQAGSLSLRMTGKLLIRKTL